MICLIASSYLNARKWAKSQHLEDSEWFYPNDVTDLYKKQNFHTIVVADGIEHASNTHINLLVTTAWKRGRIGRQ